MRSVRRSLRTLMSTSVPFTDISFCRASFRRHFNVAETPPLITMPENVKLSGIDCQCTGEEDAAPVHHQSSAMEEIPTCSRTNSVLENVRKGVTTAVKVVENCANMCCGDLGDLLGMCIAFLTDSSTKLLSSCEDAYESFCQCSYAACSPCKFCLEEMGFP